MGYAVAECATLRLDDLRPEEDIPLLIRSLSEHRGHGTIERRYRTKAGMLIRVSLQFRDMSVVQKDHPLGDACFVIITDVRAA
jgi:hypothetical protein